MRPDDDGLIDANVLFTLMESNALTPLTAAQQAVLLVGGTFVLFMLFSVMHPLLSFATVIFASVMIALGVTYEMIMAQVLIPVVLPLLGVQAAWFGALAYRMGRAVAARHRPQA